MEEKNVNEVEVKAEEVKAEETKTQEVPKENAAPSEKKKENALTRFGKTLWRWTKRTFMGGANAFFNEQEDNEDKDGDEKVDSKVFEVEKIISPGKQRLKAFLSKKLAVGATVLLVAMFAVMMIGPIFNPYNAEYMEESQKNISPGLNMMSVPRSMDDEIKSISSVSKFSVGLSKSGEVAVWGEAEGLNWSAQEIPQEVKNERIVHAAAGSDHIIAIGESGKVYGWGQGNLAQYGPVPKDNAAMQFLYTYMPDKLLSGTIEVNEVKQLVCGMQVSAIVMNSGKVYMWGNHNNGATNMSSIKALNNVEKIAFTNDAAVALLKDGTFATGNTKKFDYIYVKNEAGEKQRVVLKDYLAENHLKVVDIACARGSVALVLDNGAIVITGNIYTTEDAIPTLNEGEKFVSVAGGIKHYTAITSEGRVLSWGDNYFNQTKVPKKAFFYLHLSLSVLL